MSIDWLVLFGPHILVGGTALALFWRALLAAKGSAAHRLAGRRYLWLVVPLLVTIIPIGLRAMPQERAYILTVLAYLSLVFATAGWTAWRAVRDRDDVTAFRGPVFRGLGLAMVLAGGLLLGVGIARGAVLPVGFSVIGIVYGGAMLGFLGARAQPGWWLAWHLNGICLLFAAIHASFLRLMIRAAVPAWDTPELHAGAQLGTIALAFLLRQWLGARYLGGPRRVATEARH